MAKSKKITVTDLNKLDSELNKQTVIKILEGKYEVNIQSVFRNSDIENMLLDYMTVLQKLNESPEANLKNSYSLYLTLMLRYFSDLPIPKSNDITELIKVTKVLKDTGITTEVVNAFPADQLEYLTKRAKETSESLETLLLNNSEVPVQ